MLKSIREIGVKLSLLWDKKHAEDAHKAINGLASSMKGIGAQAAAAAGTGGSLSPRPDLRSPRRVPQAGGT